MTFIPDDFKKDKYSYLTLSEPKLTLLSTAGQIIYCLGITTCSLGFAFFDQNLQLSKQWKRAFSGKAIQIERIHESNTSKVAKTIYLLGISVFSLGFAFFDENLLLEKQWKQTLLPSSQGIREDVEYFFRGLMKYSFDENEEDVLDNWIYDFLLAAEEGDEEQFKERLEELENADLENQRILLSATAHMLSRKLSEEKQEKKLQLIHKALEKKGGKKKGKINRQLLEESRLYLNKKREQKEDQLQESTPPSKLKATSLIFLSLFSHGLGVYNKIHQDRLQQHVSSPSQDEKKAPKNKAPETQAKEKTTKAEQMQSIPSQKRKEPQNSIPIQTTETKTHQNTLKQNIPPPQVPVKEKIRAEQAKNVSPDKTEERQSNTLIITGYTKGNALRTQMSKQVVHSQKTYAEKHGYRFMEFDENHAKNCKNAQGKQEECQPHWSKIALINSLLQSQKTDDILWLDDDMPITNQKISIEQIRKEFPGADQASIIVTKDAQNWHGGDPQTSINTGLLLVKNNEFSKQFFAELYEKRYQHFQGDQTYGTCKNQACLHEQAMMADMLRNKKYLGKGKVLVIEQRSKTGVGLNTFARENYYYDSERGMELLYGGDRRSGRWQPGDWAGQCTGMPVKNRLECIQELMKKTVQLVKKPFNKPANP